MQQMEKEIATGLPIGSIDHVAEVFKYLDKIGEPKLKREKTRAQRLHNAPTDRLCLDFVSQVTPFIRHINALLSDHTLATIFYKRMVQSKTILSETQTKRYKQLLILYLDLIDQVSEELRRDMNETAVDLLHYLHTHNSDPDSAIIGLTPTDVVLSKVTERDCGDLVAHSREALVSEVLKWSNLQDGEEIKLHVRTMAANLRGVDKLKVGDVVIMKTPTRTSFARVSNEKSDTPSVIRVFLDPLEGSTVPVENWRVYPLSQQILHSIHELRQMEKATKPITEGFYSSLHQEVKMRIFESLSDLGIDLNLLQRASELNTSVLDLAELRKASQVLTELADNTSGVIFRNSEAFMHAKVDEYVAQLDSKNLFMPKYEETMEQLRNYYQQPLARTRIRQLQGACDLAIDNLSLEMRKLLNGIRKAEITEWWLKLIEMTVNEFLRARGYEFNAVPDNYIERPPANVEVVKQNLHLVQKILDPSSLPDVSPLLLIDELRAKVYPVIDDFIRKALVALSESLSTPLSYDLTCLVDHLPEIFATVAQVRGNISPTLADQLFDMVQDLKYLCEMKRLEYAQGEKSLHIVPVAGLVMGSFVRLENELKTVIELWDYAEIDLEEQIPSSPDNANVSGVDAPAEGSTSEKDEDTEDSDEKIEKTKSFQLGQSVLHRAVCTEKLKSVLRILTTLENGKELINVPNAKGWTPLHIACLLGNFPICETLLDVERIDVTCKNEDGTTPLHFLVRRPDTEEQIPIIHKLIELGAAVNIANRHGETPLHGASLKGNMSAVKILISHGADPNAVTIGGEAPIHYAVTGGASAVVEFLIESGADPALPAQRGTPLELAEGYKNESIVKHLRASVVPQEADRGWPRTTRTPPGNLAPAAAGVYDDALRDKVRIGVRTRKSSHKSRYSISEMHGVITPFTPTHIVAALQRDGALSPPSPLSDSEFSPPQSPLSPTPKSPPSSISSDSPSHKSPSPQFSSPPQISGAPVKLSSESSRSGKEGDGPNSLELRVSSPLSHNSPGSPPISIPHQHTPSGRSQTFNVLSSPDLMFPFSWRAGKSPATVARTPFLQSTRNVNFSEDTYSQSPEKQARKLKSDSDNTGWSRKHSSTTPTTLTSVSAPANAGNYPPVTEDQPGNTPPYEESVVPQAELESPTVPSKPLPSLLEKHIPHTRGTFTTVNRFAAVLLPGVRDVNSVKLKPTPSLRKVKERGGTAPAQTSSPKKPIARPLPTPPSQLHSTTTTTTTTIITTESTDTIPPINTTENGDLPNLLIDLPEIPITDLFPLPTDLPPPIDLPPLPTDDDAFSPPELYNNDDLPVT